MGQSINLQALKHMGKVIRNSSLLVPHLIVKDIRNVDFPKLKDFGIHAIAFDKDNTLTPPYEDQIYKPFEVAWKSCKSTFGSENIVIVSNSAGTPDDLNGRQAAKIEQTLGVSVLIHQLKKPSGGDKLKLHFGQTSNVAIIGDRLFTDVLYGNLNGMLTIFVTQIITEKKDNFMANKIRRFEYQLLKFLMARGYSAPQIEISDFANLVKNPEKF
ncbi:hypothetical protein G9A89_001841 [Geosiphon pyriformis]|nr:hypothetical protein G9A89_001841 [Geosiphon pyriformis]